MGRSVKPRNWLIRLWITSARLWMLALLELQGCNLLGDDRSVISPSPVSDGTLPSMSCPLPRAGPKTALSAATHQPRPGYWRRAPPCAETRQARRSVIGRGRTKVEQLRTATGLSSVCGHNEHVLGVTCVVHIGAVVRGPACPFTATVQAYLRNLREWGVAFVPQVVGYDEQDASAGGRPY